MGTAAVLRSQDCLKLRSAPKITRTPPSSTPTRYDRSKRRYPAVKDNRDPNPTVVKFPSPNLVMEKVTILKRGADLKYPPSKVDGKVSDSLYDEDSMLCSTDRLGPEPDMVPKQVRLTDLKPNSCVSASAYAGAAFFSSPAPSSLPFPAFFARKNNDLATKDLRRLLRLEP